MHMHVLYTALCTHPPCLLACRTCFPSTSFSSQRFTFKHNLYKLREERDIKPSAFAQLVSATLYERRFGPYFCQPVIGVPAAGVPAAGSAGPVCLGKVWRNSCFGTMSSSCLPATLPASHLH
jgi:hypothetical protein